jgi:hypothetical protein
MRRLRTTEQYIRHQVDAKPQPRTRQAFLLTAYIGNSTSVLVQLSDPRTGSRGAVLRARVRPGVAPPPLTTITAGTPVTLVIRHGQAEVIGLITSRV